MAIFKRGDRITSDVPSPVTAPVTDHTNTSDDVATAEEKVKSLLGQHAQAATTSDGGAAATVFRPHDGTSAPTPTTPPQASPAPETSPQSVLDNNDNSVSDDDKKDTKEETPKTSSVSSIEVKDGGDGVIEDVDREVQDMIGKLEVESQNLDGQISSKTDQIGKLQTEIDAHNARKAEIDKKAVGLRQVVGNNANPLSTL